MKTIQNKEFSKKFLRVFRIHIYSEDRYSDVEEKYWNTLYEHFVQIYLFNWKVFSTHWMTGVYMLSGETNTGGFYERD